MIKLREWINRVCDKVDKGMEPEEELLAICNEVFNICIEKIRRCRSWVVHRGTYANMQSVINHADAIKVLEDLRGREDEG